MHWVVILFAQMRSEWNKRRQLRALCWSQYNKCIERCNKSRTTWLPENSRGSYKCLKEGDSGVYLGIADKDRFGGPVWLFKAMKVVKLTLCVRSVCLTLFLQIKRSDWLDAVMGRLVQTCTLKFVTKAKRWTQVSGQSGVRWAFQYQVLTKFKLSSLQANPQLSFVSLGLTWKLINMLGHFGIQWRFPCLRYLLLNLNNPIWRFYVGVCCFPCTSP